MRLAIPLGETAADNGLVHKTVGSNANEITLSLRTRDPDEAKVRKVAAEAYLYDVFEQVRGDQSKRLTRKQCLALAGEVYHSMVNETDQNLPPIFMLKELSAGNTRERWSQSARSL